MPKLLAFSLNMLADIFYPKYCFGCRRAGRYLCKFCVSQIPQCLEDFCIVCNKASANGYTHQQCQTHLTPDRLLSAFPYQYELISEMIITGKYYFVSEVFAVLGLLAAEQIKRQCGLESIKDFVICPLPLHLTKQRWRGFNQADLIAGAFEHVLQIPAMHLLLRIKNTKTQKDLDSEARKINIANAFRVLPVATTNGLPEKVILVDDVCTTGQTLLEATKALKHAGVKIVWCISIAKD